MWFIHFWLRLRLRVGILWDQPTETNFGLLCLRQQAICCADPITKRWGLNCMSELWASCERWISFQPTCNCTFHHQQVISAPFHFGIFLRPSSFIMSDTPASKTLGFFLYGEAPADLSYQLWNSDHSASVFLRACTNSWLFPRIIIAPNSHT